MVFLNPSKNVENNQIRTINSVSKLYDLDAYEILYNTKADRTCMMKWV